MDIEQIIEQKQKAPKPKPEVWGGLHRPSETDQQPVAEFSRIMPTYIPVPNALLNRV